MQSARSIARALYRIVFRGGTPQRIQFSIPLLMAAIGLTVAAAIGAGWLFFNMSAIEIGLALFTLLSGLYIGSALLTRTVPRTRLRASLLTVLLLLAAAGLILLMLTPLKPYVPTITLSGGLVVLAGVLSGTTNALQFARGGTRGTAALVSTASAAVLGAFYVTLRWLLETVFS
jgi:hypothetical protein